MRHVTVQITSLYATDEGIRVRETWMQLVSKFRQHRELRKLYYRKSQLLLTCSDEPLFVLFPRLLNLSS